MPTERGITINRPVRAEDIKGLLKAPELPEEYVYVVAEAKVGYVRVDVVEIATGRVVMSESRAGALTGPGGEWLDLPAKAKVEAVASLVGQNFLNERQKKLATEEMAAFEGAWGGGATS